MGEKARKIGREILGAIPFWLCMIAFYVVCYWIYLKLGSGAIQLGTEEIRLELAWAMLILVHAAFSFTSTDFNERAIKTFLAFPIQEIPPGRPAFVPLFLSRLEILDVEIQQMEIPGEPEQVWRGRDENDRELPLGIGRDGKPLPPPTKNGVELPWVQPLRATFDDNDPETDQDPLKKLSEALGNNPTFKEPPRELREATEVLAEADSPMHQADREPEDPATKRVTTETKGAVQWRVRELATFIRSFDSFENAERQLADIASSELTSALQAGTLARALANQELLGLYIAMKIRERVGHKLSYQDPTTGDTRPGYARGETVHCRRGVEIIGFQLKSPDLSHELNKAIQRILEAKADAGAMVRRAHGERKRMQLLNEQATSAGGLLMLELERLATITKTIGLKSDKLVLLNSDDPLARLFGAAVGIQRLLEDQRSAPAPTGSGTP